MPRIKRVLASELTVAELRHLLETKGKAEVLEAKKAKLEEQLAAVNAKLAQLGASVKPAGRPGRKPGRKPGRQAGRPAAKKAVRRVARQGKAPARKQAGGKRPSTTGIQDVVVNLIRANGKPMAFQDILGAITKRKLVKTRSKNFANVLRRTISTSTVVKRVGRGTYSIKG